MKRQTTEHWNRGISEKCTFPKNSNFSLVFISCLSKIVEREVVEKTKSIVGCWDGKVIEASKYTNRVFLGFIRKCRHVTHSKKYRRCCRHYFQLTERNGKKVICICGGFFTVFQPEFHFSSERRKI